MKRILYFSGYRMVAQEWSGKSFKSSVYFEPDEQGLDLFKAYLVSLKGEPLRMMVDLIEEEFRQIRLPLIRGTDHQQLVQRNFTKFFRNSVFRQAVSQKIIKKERKEEQMMLMGLTNQELLKPWLDIIDETRTPLSGIVTLPLISEQLVGLFKSENRCQIVVSQQVPSNLRQTVFVEGKLVLSRLVPIASFYQGDYASDVLRDIEGTQRYLASQRIIDRNDEIVVHVLSNERHKDVLKHKCENEAGFLFQIHAIDDVIKQLKLSVEGPQEFSTLLFCHLALNNYFANHYARGEEKKYFYHYLSSISLKLAAVVSLSAALGWLGVSVAKGFLYDGSINEMRLLEQKYVSRFNQLNEQKLDFNISTSQMKDVIQTVEKLRTSYLKTPLPLVEMLSQDIALFSDMRVTKLNWLIASDENAIEPDTQSVAAQDNRRRRGSRRTVVRRGKKLFEIAVLDGRLLNFEGDYRYALSVVDDLQNSLVVSGKYDKVELLKKPLNIEPNKEISGEAVPDNVNKTPQKFHADFSVRVVREVKFNAR